MYKNFSVECRDCRCQFEIESENLFRKSLLMCPNCETRESDKTLSELKQKTNKFNEALEDLEVCLHDTENFKIYLRS